MLNWTDEHHRAPSESVLMGKMDDCMGKYPQILRDRRGGKRFSGLFLTFLKVWRSKPSIWYLSAVGFCSSPSLWGDSCACPGSLSVHKRHPWPGESQCCLVDPGSPLSPSVAMWPPSLYGHSGACGWRNSKACRSLEAQRDTFSPPAVFKPLFKIFSIPSLKISLGWFSSSPHWFCLCLLGLLCVIAGLMLLSVDMGLLGLCAHRPEIIMQNEHRRPGCS